MLPFCVMRLVGKSSEPTTMEVEKGAIRKYADAVGDRNPLYWDEEYARTTAAGAIVAPPGFFGWPQKWEHVPAASELVHELVETVGRAGYTRVLAGGQEFQFFRSVRAGDTLKAVPTILQVDEREGKSGAMVVSTVETTYTNQDAEMVATVRLSIIQR